MLVAGIGNVFMGDDAFGVEVVKRLVEVALPPGVRVVDFGIRGIDLAYALLEDHAAAILVDALQRGGSPGTIYVLEVGSYERPLPGGDSVATHGLHPAKALELVAMLGGAPGRIFVVGCEPEPCDDELEIEGRMGLSAPVAAAIDEASAAVLSLIERIRRDAAANALAAAGA